ncbi:MAG: type II toxin-antitoxin system VapC family toxin [Ignavibacteriae bacterium]|nr:type II toxin-antitoxin system VapC family toxin [Ignavibacteriota bacterium]
MKLLLDTHTFLWWDNEPERLSTTAFDLCADVENTLILSVVSVWEMQIKHQLGRLQLRKELRDLVASQRKHNKVKILSLSLEHIYSLSRLPFHHKDPFDPALVAQTEADGLSLLSVDPIMRRYTHRVIW